MSRTAEPPCWYQSPTIRLFFCLLIGCLMAHFLIEDALLFARSSSLASASTKTSQANHEEVQHLDDLVYIERLPDSHADPVRPVTFLWITPAIRQVSFRIFTPPKS